MSAVAGVSSIANTLAVACIPGHGCLSMMFLVSAVAGVTSLSHTSAVASFPAAVACP
jgi:hypothetical protein